LIQVNNAMDGTVATVEQHLVAATALLEAVRSGGRQLDILPFLAHLRTVALEADAAMAEALTALDDTGSLEDKVFARFYAAGSAHGALLMFCRSFTEDESDHVRLACASGVVILESIAVRPEYAKVILAVQERLAKES
jgi:hypothetical protein